MTTAPSTYPCPHCGTVASAVTGCPGCGRGPDADALEVMRLDAELRALGRDLERARSEVVTLQRRITDMTTQRNAVAFRVVASRDVPVVAPEPAKTEPAKTEPAKTEPAKTEPARTEPAGVEPRLSTLTVQNVLFALGGLLLIVAAAVFTAVAWAQVGVTGRAAILAAATAAVLAIPPLAKRRGLTAAAETLAAVGLLMILLDGYAAWAVDFLQVRSMTPEAYASTVCAVTAAVAFGYGKLAALRGPAIAALLAAQPVLPLLAASADARPTTWSLTLTGVVALNIAVLHHRRFTVSAVSAVAYVCASLAAAASALIAVADLITAGTPLAAAAAGGALVLVTAVTTIATVLSGNRAAQTIAAALLTVSVAVAAGAWSLLLGTPSAAVLRLSAVALSISALVAALLPRLPRPVGRGPWTAALLVSTVPALGAAGAVAWGALASAEAAQPFLNASLTHRVDGPDSSLIPAVVAVLCSYAILLTTRPRTATLPPAATPPTAVPTTAVAPTGVPPTGVAQTAVTLTDLALTALAATALLLPAALGFPWWTAAILDFSAAAIALTASRTQLRPIYGPLLAAALTTHALIVAMGDPAVAAAAFTTVTVIGFSTAFLVRPEHHPLAVTSTATALLSVPPAVSLTLLALDAPPTWQVRAQLLIAIALTAAARTIAWHRPTFTVVALLMSAALPVIALAGDDPAALYAAAALLLIAATRSPALLIAAVIPASVLLYALAPELSTILLDPYTNLSSFWSGTAPTTDPARWSSLAALLIVALAAAVTGYRTAGPRTALWAAAPILAIAAPLTLAAAEAPWPSVPLTGLLTGLLGIVAITTLPLPSAAAPAHHPALASSPSEPAPASPPAPPPTTAPPSATASAPASPPAPPSTPPLAPPSTTESAPASPPAPPSASASAPALPSTPPSTAGSASAPPPATASASASASMPVSPSVAPSPTVSAPASPSEPPAPFAAPSSSESSAAPFAAPSPLASGSPSPSASSSVSTSPSLSPAAGRKASSPTASSPVAWTGIVFVPLVTAGLAGTTPVQGALLTAFALVTVAAVVCGVAGRELGGRILGWTGAAAGAVVVAYTAGQISGLGAGAGPFSVLAAAAVVAGLEAVLAARRPREAPAVAAVAQSSALIALLIAGTPARAALIATLWAVVLGLRALRPGEVRTVRFRYTIAAAAAALVGWWLFLNSRDVTTPEIYTLPAAVLALGAGWLARRERPALPSWTAYGPALAAGFLPTLAVIGGDSPEYVRRLLLGLAALVVLLAGARARLQAPVVVGALMLTLTALHELIQVWDLVPRWVPLAVGGLLLVGIATTMEQRRRDLLRLRTAVGRMT